MLDMSASSPDPELAIWNAQHICVAEHQAYKDAPKSNPGEIVRRHQLEGNRGHYSVAAFAFVKIDCYGFPHDTIVQLRTHHTSGSDVRFLVQSSRYTSKRFIDVAKGDLEPQEVFYWRPVDSYISRNGKYYNAASAQDYYYACCQKQCERYRYMVEDLGQPFEQARNILPQGIRQDFTVASTIKGFWHILDQRSKKDSQLEVQIWSEMVTTELETWCPTLMKWYKDNRYGKALLAP